MKIIICLDDKNGYSFNHRRQSSDLFQQEHFLTRLKDQPLAYNAYSQKLLNRNQMILSKEFRPEGSLFLKDHNPDTWYLVENVSITGYYHYIDELYIYYWNRSYPGDLFFVGEFLKDFELLESEEFQGHSHDQISFRHYRRKKHA